MYKLIFIILLLNSFLFQERGTLNKYDFRQPVFIHDLDIGLAEISGLAVDEQGRLFAHNDEIGSAFELDPKNGRIIKWFYLGPDRLYGDFEAIAIAGEEFFLITSKGVLYKFYDQPDGKYSKYELIRTGLKGSAEIEGMCYDPKTHSLLLASKRDTGDKNTRTIFSYSLKEMKLSDKPRFTISLSELKKKFKVKNFSPSGMERDKKSGNFLILSSGEKGILEISPEGRLLNYQVLNQKYHPQPEGITILNDGTILIADEGGDQKATLSGYK
jgi:uncharacterized protein YjiK